MWVGLAGGGFVLMLLLVLLVSLAVYARNNVKAKSFTLTSDVSSDASSEEGRGSKDCMVVVSASTDGHTAHLLPKVDPVNLSPFDKDFSFDFSSSIGEGGGYQPTPYSLEPPCPCVPPCSSPCRCWESDSGVGGDDQAGGLELARSDDTETLSNRIDLQLNPDNVLSRDDEGFNFHNVLLDGFTCLRVSPVDDVAVVHRHNKCPAETLAQTLSSPTQSFSSFKSKSNSKDPSRSGSFSNCFTNNVAAELSHSLTLALGDRAAPKKNFGKEQTSKYFTVDRNANNNNNNKLNTNFNNLNNSHLTILELTSLSNVCKDPNISSPVTNVNTTATKLARGDSTTRGRQELMLSLSSDLGFSETISPTVSPLPCRYRTLPSSLRKKSSKFTPAPIINRKHSPMSSSPLTNYALQTRTNAELSATLSTQLGNGGLSSLVISLDTSPDISRNDGTSIQGNSYKNQIPSGEGKSNSLPAWVRKKKGPIGGGGEDLTTICEKETHWSKKHRNRMRSDAAQIIALSRSNAFGPDIEGGSIPITGALTTPSPQTLLLSPSASTVPVTGPGPDLSISAATHPLTTGCTAQLSPSSPHEAVVVYRERTAL